jgi:hypothetical protein
VWDTSSVSIPLPNDTARKRVAHFDRRLGRHVRYAETLSAKDIEPLRQLYTKINAKGQLAPGIQFFRDLVSMRLSSLLMLTRWKRAKCGRFCKFT